jgi:hypothetical protein
MTSTGFCDPRRVYVIRHMIALIVIICAFWEYGTWHSPYYVVSGGFLIGQQLKRLFEIIWVHTYSGQLTNATAVLICFTNLSIVMTCVYTILHRKPSLAEDRFSAVSWPIPLVILAWSGNFYHHLILSKLRPHHTPIRRYNSAAVYRVPRRGWFLRAVCPHYFFEILAWLAFALIVNRPPVYGVAIAIGCFLVGRSHRTRFWYYRHVGGFAPNLSRLLPFVF